MPDENKQAEQSQNTGIKLDLSDFDIGIDDGSGELNLTRREPKKEEVKQEISSEQQTQQPDDKFATFDSRLNTIVQQQQTQSNALQQMINFLLNQPKDQQEQKVDRDQLEQVFGDADKGSNFLNSVTSTIEKLIDNKLNGIQPLLNQLSLSQEIQSVQAQPDYLEYLPAMKFIIDINPGVTIPQAYTYAKQQGMKSPALKQNQPANVSNISDRRLPEKIQSSNATMKTKEVSSLRDALELALDQLTGTD